MAKRKRNSVIGIGLMSEKDWQAEEDLRTLQRAVEIKNDPRRHKAALACAREKMQELAEISVGGKAD